MPHSITRTGRKICFFCLSPKIIRIFSQGTSKFCKYMSIQIIKKSVHAQYVASLLYMEKIQYYIIFQNFFFEGGNSTLHFCQNDIQHFMFDKWYWSLYIKVKFVYFWTFYKFDTVLTFLWLPSCPSWQKLHQANNVPARLARMVTGWGAHGPAERLLLSTPHLPQGPLIMSHRVLNTAQSQKTLSPLMRNTHILHKTEAQSYIWILPTWSHEAEVSVALIVSNNWPLNQGRMRRSRSMRLRSFSFPQICLRSELVWSSSSELTVKSVLQVTFCDTSETTGSVHIQQWKLFLTCLLTLMRLPCSQSPRGRQMSPVVDAICLIIVISTLWSGSGGLGLVIHPYYTLIKK